MRRATTCMLILSIAVIAVTSLSSADLLPIKKLRAGIPPFAVVERALKHNDMIAVHEQRPPTPAMPHMIWLADCDARIQPSLFYPDSVDTIYTVRNPGNQLSPSVGAVDYGVNELFSPVLLITGNTSNDSLRLFNRGYNHLAPSIRHDLDNLLPALGEMANGKANEALLVERNVDFQVETAVKRYRQRIESGRLTVIGGVIDLDNQYGLGRNRLIIINIDGETNPERLRARQALIRLDKRLLAMVGKRAAEK